MSGAKKLSVVHVKNSFAVLLKFYCIRGCVAVLWAATPSFSMHVYNCAPHWTYIAIKSNDGCNQVILAPSSTWL